MEDRIKILIADDHTLFVEGLKQILAEISAIEISGVAQNGKELLELVRKNKPDVILLDINMPVLNGLDALNYLKKDFSNVRVIMLSTYSEEHMIEKAKALGANGYLLKNVNKADLIQTISLVHSGQSCFPYQQPTSKPSVGEPDNFLKAFNLTKREQEIIVLINQGLTNQQMAETLHLSIYTIETHRKNIMHKLKLRTPGELIKFIVQNNL